MLIIHVCIAVISILMGTLSVIKPSNKKLNILHATIVATVASGSYLILSLDRPILKSCISGLCYLAIVGVLTVLAHKKLNLCKQEEKSY